MSDTPKLEWQLTMTRDMHEAWTAAGKPEPAAWLWAEVARLREVEAKYDALLLDFERHPSHELVAARVERDHFVAEVERLREFEAREAVVANAIVCIMEVAQNPTEKTFQKLMDHLNSFDSQLAGAIEALGRRDKIRRLEGAIEEVERIIRDLRETANVAAAHHNHHGATRHTYDADRLQLERLSELQAQLAEARAVK